MNHMKGGYIGRRGELLAELFLTDLSPDMIDKTGPRDTGIDFFVRFRNDRGGTNTFGVEVKSTELPVRSTFTMDRKSYANLAYSNVPTLLLLVNVKLNKLYYAWVDRYQLDRDAANVRVRFREIDDHVKLTLRRQMTSGDLPAGVRAKY
jgi:Domain of unknown function (DUF4365)